jgi:hypothetical protein
MGRTNDVRGVRIYRSTSVAEKQRVHDVDELLIGTMNKSEGVKRVKW